MLPSVRRPGSLCFLIVVHVRSRAGGRALFVLLTQQWFTLVSAGPVGVYRPPETPSALLRKAFVNGRIPFDNPALV